MQTDDAQFYHELPVNEIGLSKLFARTHLFHNFPTDWHVIITDVESSTEAVAQGRHQDINMIATESIVAVLNIIYKNELEIPFFFGGDGATFIIPGSMLNQVVHSLSLHSENVLNTFGLVLRVGHVPVKEISEKGYGLSIAKARTSSLLSIPVILGNGLSYAERKVKGAEYLLADFEQLNALVDLQGMQCRWDKIEPPENHEEVISLLVMATHESKQPEAFSEVITFIDEIYGSVVSRKPVTVIKLQLKASFYRIKKEVQSQMIKFVFINTFIKWVKTLLGTIYFKTTKGQQYLTSLVQMTDDLVLDGKINTVISGTVLQKERLEAALRKMEHDQKIVFGIYASSASVMSCYVRDMDLKHIHFVDGANGGYTKAAGVLKRKLAKMDDLLNR